MVPIELDVLLHHYWSSDSYRYSFVRKDEVDRQWVRETLTEWGLLAFNDSGREPLFTITPKGKAFIEGVLMTYDSNTRNEESTESYAYEWYGTRGNEGEADV